MASTGLLWGEGYFSSGDPLLEALKGRARNADRLRLDKDTTALGATRAIVGELEAIIDGDPVAAAHQLLFLTAQGWTRMALLLPSADPKSRLEAGERAVALLQMCRVRPSMPQLLAPRVDKGLANVFRLNGILRAELRDMPGAERDTLAGLDLAQAGLAEHPDDVPWRANVISGLWALAGLRKLQERDDEATPIYEECVALRRAQVAAVPSANDLHLLRMTLAAHRVARTAV